ncbi:MAG: hypothetical protein IPI04_07200 [Ignavibacteria bacterium]|nr:hypothetical protein [Ignavibacteria bacterium]
MDANIVLDTINRPELYLQRVNMVFTILNVTALYFLGYVSYIKIGNIFAAIFIQFTPFISKLIIYQLTLIIPEPILIFLILVLLTITISFLNEKVLTKKKNLIYIILFGITCGLVLATKISALPIMIIPFLLLKKFIYKSYFVLIAFITFSILFFPICPESSVIWIYVFNNILHSGKYGAGPANFVNIDQIIPKIEQLFNEYIFFCIIYLLIIVILMMQFVPKFKNQIRSNKYFLLIAGIFVIMSAFILLVIKQNELYYLLPALMFSVVGLFAVNSVVSDLLPKFFSKSSYLYIYFVFVIFTIPNTISFKNSISWFSIRKNESHKIIKYLNDNHRNSIIVSSDLTSSMPTALYSGLNFAGGEIERYFSILTQKYPDYIYFQRWTKEFVYLEDNKNLKNKLLNSNTIVFHSVDDANLIDFKKIIIELTKNPNLIFKEVYSNKNGEKVYLVTLK